MSPGERLVADMPVTGPERLRWLSELQEAVAVDSMRTANLMCLQGWPFEAAQTAIDDQFVDYLTARLREGTAMGVAAAAELRRLAT